MPACEGAEKTTACRHCAEEGVNRSMDDCYRHCAASMDGRHQISPYEAAVGGLVPGQDTPGSPLYIDVWCRACGQSGAVTITSADVAWGE